MKGCNLTVCGAIAGLVLSLPLSGLAAEEKPGNPPDQAGVQTPGGASVVPLVYKPPRKGAPAPGSRRGGGTRGMNKSVPVISLLAPDHVGLTLHEQPVLFWFTPTKQNNPVEFTLIGENADTPAVETKLPPPAQPGLQQIRLSDYKVKLSPGERYQWSVSVILDAEERSANIVAMGAIERIERDKLEQPLATNFSKAEAPKRYAEAGIWYDAVMAISDLIQSNPADTELRQQRAALLEQVGLADVGMYDVKFRARRAE
ncbi:MAG: DUF928 domain-containing protein [bacterium]